MTTTVTESAPSAPTPATAVHNVYRFTNTDPETRDDSQDPWRFEVSLGISNNTLSLKAHPFSCSPRRDFCPIVGLQSVRGFFIYDEPNTDFQLEDTIHDSSSKFGLTLESWADVKTKIKGELLNAKSELDECVEGQKANGSFDMSGGS
jgi:hypothetical protein